VLAGLQASFLLWQLHVLYQLATEQVLGLPVGRLHLFLGLRDLQILLKKLSSIMATTGVVTPSPSVNMQQTTAIAVASGVRAAAANVCAAYAFWYVDAAWRGCGDVLVI
jgi:hypothetical protein